MGLYDVAGQRPSGLGSRYAQSTVPTRVWTLTHVDAVSSLSLLSLFSSLSLLSLCVYMYVCLSLCLYICTKIIFHVWLDPNMTLITIAKYFQYVLYGLWYHQLKSPKCLYVCIYDVCLSLCVCMYVPLSLSLSLSLSVYMYVCLSLSLCLYICTKIIFHVWLDPNMTYHHSKIFPICSIWSLVSPIKISKMSLSLYI